MATRKNPRGSGRLTWSTAASFRELCEANIRFIRGELRSTPVHGGPIDVESAEIVEGMIELNRKGFLTTASQPALSDGRHAQRAWVEGFASESTALQLGAKTLHSDLLIAFFAPTEPPSSWQVPITQDDGQPFTWAGHSGVDDLDGFLAECRPSATEELMTAWFVVAIDPVWGRNDYLWQVLLEPPRDGYSAKPHPDLSLTDDAVDAALATAKAYMRQREAAVYAKRSKRVKRSKGGA